MQTLGTVVGAILQLVIMKQIISSHRELLTDVQGNNFWSGQNVQSFNTEAVTWGALAKVRCSPFSCSSSSRGTRADDETPPPSTCTAPQGASSPLLRALDTLLMTSMPCRTYFIIPMAILIGLACPLPFYALHRFFPRLGADKVVVPLLVYAFGYLNAGINSQNFFCVVLAFWSQWYLRRYRSTWFRKYNFLLSAALDGGTQVFVFVAVRLLLSPSPSFRSSSSSSVRTSRSSFEPAWLSLLVRNASLTPRMRKCRPSPSRAAQDGPSRCRASSARSGLVLLLLTADASLSLSLAQLVGAQPCRQAARLCVHQLPPSFVAAQLTRSLAHRLRGHLTSSLTSATTSFLACIPLACVERLAGIDERFGSSAAAEQSRRKLRLEERE